MATSDARGQILDAAKRAGVNEPPEESAEPNGLFLLWTRGDRDLGFWVRTCGLVEFTATDDGPDSWLRVQEGEQWLTDEHLARSFAWLLKGTPDA